LSTFGQQIIDGLKVLVQDLELQETMLHQNSGCHRLHQWPTFETIEEAEEWWKRHPEFKGVTSVLFEYDDDGKLMQVGHLRAKRENGRVDQMPPKPYNAVIEPMDDA